MIYLFPLKSIPIPADEKKQKQKRRKIDDDGEAIRKPAQTDKTDRETSLSSPSRMRVIEPSLDFSLYSLTAAAAGR